jgi:hypothetical protein
MILLQSARLRRWFWAPRQRQFPRRYWSAELDVSRQIYVPLIEKAMGENRSRDAQNLAGEWRAQSDWAEECIRSIETRDLVNRARRLYISLDEMPKPEGERFHYRYAADGTTILHDITFNALGKAVTAAEDKRKQELRATLDLVVKVTAASVGVIGALIGLVSVLGKK